jgi:hypothetical protein
MAGSDCDPIWDAIPPLAFIWKVPYESKLVCTVLTYLLRGTTALTGTNRR